MYQDLVRVVVEGGGWGTTTEVCEEVLEKRTKKERRVEGGGGRLGNGPSQSRSRFADTTSACPCELARGARKRGFEAHTEENERQGGSFASGTPAYVIHSEIWNVTAG